MERTDANGTGRCLVVRHISFEDLGTFEEPIRRAGYQIEYRDVPAPGHAVRGTGKAAGANPAGAVTVEATSAPASLEDAPSLEDASLLEDAAAAELVVLLGGPVGVFQTEEYPFLITEVDVARRRLADGSPLLGVCLGAQIIARAAGAQVYPGSRGVEIGWSTIFTTEEGRRGALAPFGAQQAMFHWHGDTFDLPDGAVRLASSERYPNQVFSIGDTVLAFQCHPELDPAGIERWLVGHAVELSVHGIDPREIRAATQRHGEDLVARGTAVIRRWLGALPPVSGSSLGATATDSP